MSDLRKRFTENAEQFDALMVEMLEENQRLKQRKPALNELPARMAMNVVTVTQEAAGIQTELAITNIQSHQGVIRIWVK